MSVVIISKIIKRHIFFGLKLMPFIRHTSIYDCLDHPFVAEIEILCYVIFAQRAYNQTYKPAIFVYIYAVFTIISSFHDSQNNFQE